MLIVKEIATPMPIAASEKENVEDDFEKTTYPAYSRKSGEERAGSSFMIDDILGSKKTRPISLPDNSRKLKDRYPQVSGDLQDNYSSPNREQCTSPCHSISVRQPVKPTPMVISPLCSGFMNFGLYSPVGMSPSAYFYNQDHSVFAFPSSDLISPVDTSIYSIRNGQVLRSTVFHPANHLDFTNTITKGAGPDNSAGPFMTLSTRHSGFSLGNGAIRKYCGTGWQSQANNVIKTFSQGYIRELNRGEGNKEDKRNNVQVIGLSSGSMSYIGIPLKEKEDRFDSRVNRPVSSRRLSLNRNIYPLLKEKDWLQSLRLTERQVKTWFQNRRAKWRRLKQEHSNRGMSPNSDESPVTEKSLRQDLIHFANREDPRSSSA